MLRLYLIIYYLSVAVKISNSEQASEAIDESRYLDDDLVPTTTPSGIDEFSEVDLEKVIAIIEKAASFAHKSFVEDLLPKDEVEKLYEEMIEPLDEITELLNNPKYAYKFLKDKGINRIIVSSLDIPYPQLRTQLLTLLKILFDLTPTTTNAVIPVNVIDKLLDIFENDDNFVVKSQTLDVLSKWLPENPRIQARVMRIKGLEPFYHQITKLNTTVIHNLLALFNKILKEHIEVRNNMLMRSEIDSDKLKLYQRIGLIEQLSTHTVCDELLNIFQEAWSYSSKDSKILGPVLDLTVNIKPYCLKNYRGKAKAMELFETLLHYVKDKDKTESLEKDTSMTNVEEVLTDYVENLKSSIKDEF